MMYDEDESETKGSEFIFHVSTENLQRGWGTQFQQENHNHGGEVQEPEVTRPTTDPVMCKALAQQAFGRRRVHMDVDDLKAHYFVNPCNSSDPENQIVSAINLVQSLKAYTTSLAKGTITPDVIQLKTLSDARLSLSHMREMMSPDYKPGVPQWCGVVACEFLFMELTLRLNTLAQLNAAWSKLKPDAEDLLSAQGMRQSDQSGEQLRQMADQARIEDQALKLPAPTLNTALSKNLDILNTLCRRDPNVLLGLMEAQLTVPPLAVSRTPVPVLTLSEADEKMQ